MKIKDIQTVRINVPPRGIERTEPRREEEWLTPRNPR